MKPGFSGTGTHRAAQAGLELAVLLLQPPDTRPFLLTFDLNATGAGKESVNKHVLTTYYTRARRVTTNQILPDVVRVMSVKERKRERKRERERERERDGLHL
jgi:hypothetical protein